VELDTELHELGPGRANVIAVAHGSGDGGTLMFNAHMDVVGAGGMTQPCTPRIDGTRLYGRGAYDVKASLAAIMLAGREAVRLDPRAMELSRRSPTKSWPRSACGTSSATWSPTRRSSPNRPGSNFA
jgi:hypothetical protein